MFGETDLLTEREKKLIKVLNEVAKYFPHRQANMRFGQALMVALHDVDSGFYKHISGTDADCFNIDRVENFCIAVLEEM